MARQSQYGRELEGSMTLQKHAIGNVCTDPDCEVHNPELIEDPAFRAQAKAYFIAGMYAALAEMKHEALDDEMSGTKKTAAKVADNVADEVLIVHKLLLTP